MEGEYFFWERGRDFLRNKYPACGRGFQGKGRASFFGDGLKGRKKDPGHGPGNVLIRGYINLHFPRIYSRSFYKGFIKYFEH